VFGSLTMSHRVEDCLHYINLTTINIGLALWGFRLTTFSWLESLFPSFATLTQTLSHFQETRILLPVKEPNMTMAQKTGADDVGQWGLEDNAHYSHVQNGLYKTASYSDPSSCNTY
jgi:hypothetical protein